MTQNARSRIDNLLFEKGLVSSRTRAKALIMAGRVSVGGRVVDKAGALVDPSAEVTLKEDAPFVSRGGVKLKGFLGKHNIDVSGLTAADIGSSTGGFTDCLLKSGVSHVTAIDVGKGLIDWSLRNDKRVTLIEGRNIRSITAEEIDGKVDLAVIDVSFISLKKVLPCVIPFLKEGAAVIALIKPQFEVGKGRVGKGGIVRDPVLHAEVVSDIKEFSASLGFKFIALDESSIKGAKGNTEFLIHMLLSGN